MPIEFRCLQCLHPQKVDESKIGQQIYCHVCYFKLTVPAESTNKPIEKSQLYTLNAKPSDVQDRHELISFRCETCNTNIGVRKEQVGEEVICAECGKKIIVPESIAEIAEARRLDKLDKVIAAVRYKETYSLHDGTTELTKTVLSKDGSKQFRFHCGLCGTMLFATEEQIGTVVTCSDCETKTKVPPKTVKTETTPLPPTTFEGNTAYKIATPSSISSQDNFVPVVCQFCGTRMQAAESQIGQSKTCPDCGQQTEIKAVPKPRKKTTETTADDAYGLNNADELAPRPATAFFTSLNISAMLRKKQSELESFRSVNRPQLPRRPLTERFFVPFGHFSTWLHLLIFIAVIPLGTTIMLRVTSAAEGGNIAATFGFAIFALSFGFLVFAAFVATFCYFATFLIHFYSFTSSGMDEGEFKGEIALADYFVNGLWLFTFSFVAVLPGFFLCQSLGFTTDSLETALVIYVMMRISHWFFFPIFFLSSMEEGSMFAVVAKNTLISLYRQPFAWLRFYLLTGVLFILCDLCLLFVLWLDPAGSLFFVGLTFFFFLLAIQSLFFFRLLGRHAWLIEETDRRRRECEEEEE